MKPRRSKPNSRAIASLLPQVARRAYRRYGFAESKILTRWAEIVGETLAANTVPQRISFNRRSRIGGTLHLTSESAFATELKHLEPRLIERINSFYGFAAIARIAIHQGPIRLVRRRKATVAPVVSDAARAELDALIGEAADNDLSAALRRLGEQVLGK